MRWEQNLENMEKEVENKTELNIETEPVDNIINNIDDLNNYIEDFKSKLEVLEELSLIGEDITDAFNIIKEDLISILKKSIEKNIITKEEGINYTKELLDKKRTEFSR